jgi:hypothetical protein
MLRISLDHFDAFGDIRQLCWRRHEYILREEAGVGAIRGLMYHPLRFGTAEEKSTRPVGTDESWKRRAVAISMTSKVGINLTFQAVRTSLNSQNWLTGAATEQLRYSYKSDHERDDKRFNTCSFDQINPSDTDGRA